MSSQEPPRERRQTGEDDNELSVPIDIGRENQLRGSTLSKTEIFDLLKNERRRSVVRYLIDHGGSTGLSDIAEHIAAAENDITVRELSSTQRKRVYIGLYQCHLPKMDSMGVIAYDQDRGTIELQDSVAQLTPYLYPSEQADETDRAGTVFAGAACIAGLVSLGTLGAGELAAGWTLVGVVGIALIIGLQCAD